MYITDRTHDLIVAVQKHRPSATRPGRWNSAIPLMKSRQGMQPFGKQLLRGTPFEVAHDEFDPVWVSRDNQMGVLGKYRTRVEHIARFLDRPFETHRYRMGLPAVEGNRREVKGFLGFLTPLIIVRTARHGLTRTDFRRWTESKEFPTANKIGPKAARIVGKPKSIRRDDRMICADRHHGAHFTTRR